MNKLFFLISLYLDQLRDSVHIVLAIGVSPAVDIERGKLERIHSVCNLYLSIFQTSSPISLYQEEIHVVNLLFSSLRHCHKRKCTDRRTPLLLH